MNFLSQSHPLDLGKRLILKIKYPAQLDQRDKKEDHILSGIELHSKVAFPPLSLFLIAVIVLCLDMERIQRKKKNFSFQIRDSQRFGLKICKCVCEPEMDRKGEEEGPMLCYPQAILGDTCTVCVLSCI